MMIKSFLLGFLLLGSSSVLTEVQGASISDLASETGDLDTLSELLDISSLDRILDCRWFCSSNRFTVFAPNNAAFSTLDSSLLTSLKEDPSWRLHLRNLLLFHVSVGRLTSERIINEGSVAVRTLEGGDVTAASDGSGFVTIDNARVASADIEAENGLVHIIDAPLAPMFLQKSIYEVVSASENFSTLKAAIDAARLDEILSGVGAYTVFAPSNAAFDKLPEGTLDTLLLDPEGDLKDILLYHVLPALIPAADIAGGSVETALTGSSIDVSFAGPFWSPAVELNGSARVVEIDTLASNGIIHEIDEVLSIPPVSSAALLGIIDVASNDGSFGTLLGALETAGLTSTLRGAGKFTVFAPTDEAFNRLPSGALDDLLADTDELTDVLTYHVLDGEVYESDLERSVLTPKNGANLYVSRRLRRWFLNDSTRIDTYDIQASNGVIHVISNVLLPPPTIYERIQRNPFFDSLQLALDTAGLSTTVDEDGPFTLFAPLDSAFDKLGDDSVNALLADTSTLSQVLLYHVVDGSIVGRDLTEGSLVTKEGSSVDVSFVSRFFGLIFRSVKINDSATVGLADLKCRNGVIHILDEVLTIPP